MEGIAPVLFILIFVGAMVIWHYSRAERILEHWARDNGYEIVSREYRWFHRGPFFWWTSRAQEVFYVTVRTSDGQLRHGWVRCGGWFFGVLTKPRHGWMNDSIAATRFPSKPQTAATSLSGTARQRLLEWALLDRLSSTIPVQQFMGPLSQDESHRPPLSFGLWDLHRVVGGGLVPHPGDDGGCGTVLDRNSLRPGHGAAADRSSVIGNRTG